jgi:hypothetical protein
LVKSPGVEKAAKLANALGVSTDQLREPHEIGNGLEETSARRELVGNVFAGLTDEEVQALVFQARHMDRDGQLFLLNLAQRMRNGPTLHERRNQVVRAEEDVGSTTTEDGVNGTKSRKPTGRRK